MIRISMIMFLLLACHEPTAPAELPTSPKVLSPIWQPRWNRVPGYSLVSADPVCKKNAVGSCSGHGRGGLGGLARSL